MTPFIGFSIGIGLFLFFLLALNWQERKDRELRSKVHLHLNSQRLRGLIDIRISRFFFLFGKVVLLDVRSPIHFDFWNCTNGESWKAMKEILHDLPANARLKIRFMPDKQIRATITMEQNGES